jgi:type I restriction enzyme M protein
MLSPDTPAPQRAADEEAARQIVQRLWNFCNLLRDDGVSYGDYLEQLTYLLFLKMAHESTLPPRRRPSPVPADLDWPSLLARKGEALEAHYSKVLTSLSKQKGMLGLIFRKAQNRIRNPAMLQQLIVELIDKMQWSGMTADVKGAAYEGLLERNARDIKSGAGQYFTPRPLIQAIVDVIDPRLGEAVADPAAGTGGFLLEAYRHLNAQKPDRDQAVHLKHHAVRAYDNVESVARLCAMNFLLHGIEPERMDAAPDDLPVRLGDSLARAPTDRFDVVLTNPPFGRKSTMKLSSTPAAAVADGDDDEGDDLTVQREDFWVSTRNKQLAFVQHVKTMLKVKGRAAMVLPDNVLFEAGAGEKIRRKLLAECDAHTLLRLPTGIFYAQGVKANVLFFERRPGADAPWTKRLWVYDLRTNKDFTLRTRPLRREDLDEFVRCYNPANRHERAATWSESTPEGRWRAYGYDELVARDKCNLDLTWIPDADLAATEAVPDPDTLLHHMTEDLRAALEQLEAIQTDLARRRNPAQA